MSREPKQKPPTTPDGRYFVMKGVLWRCSDPGLGPKQRALLVEALMHARRDVGRALRAGDSEAEHQARARVHKAKVALGERGPPWWMDGAPDFNRHRVENTPYAAWFHALPAQIEGTSAGTSS
ncbi:hypothetical protein D187_001042 [Cystobacter fuscus DSM 2262]|uniref:Uncharacterized protein n=1 Tax=Cystobacter fuscus (strain ATCC 25194 / DSM 2262 / NBRC 100088 / M29) TaxID=1242864 RepID=S9QJ05_CYSF2|nr:hypothetical protein [Cystobacter fuscus]EPX61259.1 hypothetical protein D187_001042 [Cystobacter fuscus DSM 2262]